jgi:hypothetical protein
MQIEFYFGDNNFSRDKFLRTETSKNKEGVSIEKKNQNSKRKKNLIIYFLFFHIVVPHC